MIHRSILLIFLLQALTYKAHGTEAIITPSLSLPCPHIFFVVDRRGKTMEVQTWALSSCTSSLLWEVPNQLFQVLNKRDGVIAFKDRTSFCSSNDCEIKKDLWVVGWFLTQNIHIAAHLHTFESVTVNFSAMSTDHQEETAGAMPKFSVCTVTSFSSVYISSVCLQHPKVGAAPLPQFLWGSKTDPSKEKGLHILFQWCTGGLSCANLHLEWRIFS